jgi:phosphoribosylglycinamide formyltransferase-1
VTDRAYSLAVLISGNGSNLQAIIDGCAEGRIDATIRCVISNVADAYGLQRARQAGIPTEILAHGEYPDRLLYDAKLARLLDGYDVDLIVLAGFMRILGVKFINSYDHRIINLHPSLLPRHKGLDTHAHVLRAGDKMHGASVHFVTADLDSGPVISQASTPVEADDTAQTLQYKIHGLEHEILPRVVGWFAQHRVELVDGQVLLDGSVIEQPVFP